MRLPNRKIRPDKRILELGTEKFFYIRIQLLFLKARWKVLITGEFLYIKNDRESNFSCFSVKVCLEQDSCANIAFDSRIVSELSNIRFSILITKWSQNDLLELCLSSITEFFIDSSDDTVFDVNKNV